jgi:filamentous hemagglutinin
MQVGTKVRMIVDESNAANITKAMQSGDFSNLPLGGWATFDDVKSVPIEMRQKAAITSQFKPQSSGPFYVVDLEIQKPLNANIGFAGSQRDVATNLRGGSTQAEFLIPSNEKRGNYLKPISLPKKLEGN